MAATGHPWGWPVRLCPIDLPLTLFFWFVNRRLTKSVWESTAQDAVVAF